MNSTSILFYNPSHAIREIAVTVTVRWLSKLIAFWFIFIVVITILVFCIISDTKPCERSGSFHQNGVGVGRRAGDEEGWRNSTKGCNLLFGDKSKTTLTVYVSLRTSHMTHVHARKNGNSVKASYKLPRFRLQTKVAISYGDALVANSLGGTLFASDQNRRFGYLGHSLDRQMSYSSALSYTHRFRRSRRVRPECSLYS